MGNIYEDLWKNQRFNELYNLERDKLGVLPDADNDFIAYENAIKGYRSDTYTSNKNYDIGNL